MSFPLVELGDLVDEVSRWNPLHNHPDEVFVYIDLSSIDQEKKAIASVRKLVCAMAPSRARQLVRSGDVLVSTVRPNLNGVAVVSNALDGATASTGFCVLRPNIAKLDGSYLFHWVRAPAFVGCMVKQAIGASYPAVSDRVVLSSQIPLPSLPEQRRIASILDKADTLRSQRRAAVAKQDELLQSVFIDMFGDPVTNPKGWEVSSISATKSKVQIGPFGSLLHKEDYITGGVALINPMHIVAGKITPGVEQTVSPEKAIELSLYRMRAGDIVIGRRGEMGRCAVVTSAEEGMLCGTGSLFIRPDGSRFTSRYLMFALSSNSMKLYLESLSQGVTMANLNSSMVENLRIPVPPLTEQQRFTSIAEKIKKQKQQMHNSAKQLEALFASLQQRAFSGTL